MSLRVARGLPNGWLGGDAPFMGWTERKAGTARGHIGVVLHLDGALSDEELAALCRRVDALIRFGCHRGGAPVLVCDVAEIDTADLRLVDQLAQARLSARRAGGSLVFRRVGPAVRQLLSLVGLEEVLLTDVVRAASVERERQSEQREEPGVEEDVEVRHPPV